MLRTKNLRTCLHDSLLRCDPESGETAYDLRSVVQGRRLTVVGEMVQINLISWKKIY